jgi:hypothetical protein
MTHPLEQPTADCSLCATRFGCRATGSSHPRSPESQRLYRVFNFAPNLPEDVGVLRFFLECPTVIVIVEPHAGVLTEQPLETKDLGVLLLREHIDLQVEMISSVADPCLPILADHEDRRGVGRLI